MIEATMAIIALFTICYGIFTLYDYFEEERRIKRLLAELEAKRIEKLRARETGIARMMITPPAALR